MGVYGFAAAMIVFVVTYFVQFIARYVIRLEHGVQSPEETLTHARQRLLSRFGMAPHAGPEAYRPRRPLRVGVPDPAASRVRPTKRFRERPRTSRTYT